MSAIIGKPFDKTKKVIKTIFKGSPNLTTAPDLNRQFDSIGYQLDNLEKKTGFITDYKASASFTGGTLVVIPQCTYLEYLGVAFSPTFSTMSLAAVTGDVLYVILTANKETVTFSNDAGRKISGAFFSDSTSKAAADHEVYLGESISLIKSTTALPANTVGIIASYTLVVNDEGNVIETVNGVTRGESILLKVKRAFTKQTGAPELLASGQTYDTALSVIANRIKYEDPNTFSEFPATLTPDGNTYDTVAVSGASIYHKRGRMFIKTPVVIFHPDGTQAYYVVYKVVPTGTILFDNILIPPAKFTNGTYNMAPQATTYDAYKVGPSQPVLLYHDTKKIYGTGIVTPCYGVVTSINGQGEKFLALIVTLPSVRVDAHTPMGDASPQNTDFAALNGGSVAVPSMCLEVYLK